MGDGQSEVEGAMTKSQGLRELQDLERHYESFANFWIIYKTRCVCDSNHPAPMNNVRIW